jgi:hypothetical protein
MRTKHYVGASAHSSHHSPTFALFSCIISIKALLLPSGEVIAPNVFSAWVTELCAIGAIPFCGSGTVTLNSPLVWLFLYCHSPFTHSNDTIE